MIEDMKRPITILHTHTCAYTCKRVHSHAYTICTHISKTIHGFENIEKKLLPDLMVLA